MSSKKLIDVVQFNGELNMLSGRLEYLGDLVDWFIIVEGNTSHSGLPKDLIYPRNLDRYRAWQDKIIYVPYSTGAIQMDMRVEGAAWTIEKASRDQASHALSLFSKEDYCLVSDLDEIPNKQTLKALVQNPRGHEALAFQQDLFYYNLKHRTASKWMGPVLSTVGHALALGLSNLREQRWGSIPRVPGGGWHLSYWMTPEEMVQKLRQFAHQEFNKLPFTDPEFIRENISKGQDHLGRQDPSLARIPQDRAMFPQDFLEVFEKYQPE